MKKYQYLSFIIVILIIIGFSGCSGKADILFDKEFAELGEVDEGTKTDITFTFTNPGKGTLVIQDVKPACGCTVVNGWDKTVAPGASGKIPVTFNSSGYKGDVIRLINVTTNAPEKPALSLTIKARVKIPLVDVSPSKIWLAEIAPELKQLVGTFYISCNLDTPLKIEKVIPPENIKTTYTLTSENIRGPEKKGLTYKLDFIVYAPFEGSGNVEHAFTVKTNIKEKPEVTLPFYYYKKP